VVAVASRRSGVAGVPLTEISHRRRLPSVPLPLAVAGSCWWVVGSLGLVLGGMRQGGLGAADTVLGAPVAEARSETMDVIGSPAIYANFSTRPPHSLGTPDHSGSRRQGEDWQPWTQFRTQTHRGGECAEGLPTAGQLMAEERDTRSEIGTPRARTRRG
jgi:hypothetical protein